MVQERTACNAIAVSGPGRVCAFAPGHLPTMREQGVDVTTTGWFGLDHAHPGVRSRSPDATRRDAGLHLEEPELRERIIGAAGRSRG